MARGRGYHAPGHRKLRSASARDDANSRRHDAMDLHRYAATLRMRIAHVLTYRIYGVRAARRVCSVREGAGDISVCHRRASKLRVRRDCCAFGHNDESRILPGARFVLLRRLRLRGWGGQKSLENAGF